MSEDTITPAMVSAAVRVLRSWGGLRDSHLDEDAIARRMVTAALAARAPVEAHADEVGS